MMKLDAATTITRVTYTFFMKSNDITPFLGITTEVFKGAENVYRECHIERAGDKLALQTIWTKWRDFLQQGKPTKVVSGNIYGKYLAAAKEWEA